MCEARWETMVGPITKIKKQTGVRMKRRTARFQTSNDSLNHFRLKAIGWPRREALGKWEPALTLMPENAVHEQKARVLLEVGEAWGALKEASRATDLDPSWAELLT